MKDSYFATRLDPKERADAAALWEIFANDFCKHLPRWPEKVLDLGAGYGDFINGVCAKEKWAVDAWPGFAAHVNKSVRAVVADISAPINALPQAYFDLCFMSNVLEHFTIDDAEKVLAQAKRSLCAGGYLVLLQPNFPFCMPTYFDDYTHRTIFTHESLANFLTANGFVIEKVFPRYLPFSFKSRLPRSRLLAKIYLALPWRPFAAQMLLVARWPGH